MYKFILALLVAGLLSGCEKEGPMEKAGEKIDNVVEQMQDNGESLSDKIQDSGESLGDALDEAGTDIGNTLEDTCEEIKQQAGAVDTDC